MDRINALKALDAIWQNGDRIEKYGIFKYCAEKKGKQGENFLFSIIYFIKFEKRKIPPQNLKFLRNVVH